MEPTHLNCDKVEDCFDKEICLEGVKCDCDEGLCKHKECDEDSDCNNPHHCREVVVDKSFIDHQIFLRVQSVNVWTGDVPYYPEESSNFQQTCCFRI